MKNIEEIQISKLNRTFGKRVTFQLISSAALGMSFVLATINPTEINGFKSREICYSHHLEESFINENQRLCSRCGKIQPVSAFYSKGNRIDSRCKQCILAVKKSKSAEKRRLKKRTQRGRVLNVESYQVSITPLRDIASEHMEDTFRDWVDMTIGG